MTEIPVAVWQVSGATWQDMSDEAFSDAQLFMDGFAHTMWEVNVVNCEPLNQSDGRVHTWKGHAVLSWRSQSQ